MKTTIKKERPMRVIPGRSRAHRTETRIFQRDTKETYCVHPGCKFRGQIARQGVCHTTQPLVRGASWNYIDRVEKEAERHLASFRKTWRKKGGYLGHLEAAYVCGEMTAISMLDELVRLRRRVALAEAKLARQCDLARDAEHDRDQARAERNIAQATARMLAQQIQVATVATERDNDGDD